MPVYQYDCTNCGTSIDERRPVGTDSLPCFAGCGGIMQRQFVPTTNFIIPAHFRLPRGWHLPEKGSKNWENQGTSGDSQVTEKPQESFKEFFEKRNKGNYG